MKHRLGRRTSLALALVVGCLAASLALVNSPTNAQADPAPHHASEVSIFYYPWYASVDHDGHWAHWDQRATPPDDIGTNYFPAAGPYSSNDPAPTAQHMQQIAAAGIDTVVVSWWGQGSYEDNVFKSVVLPAAQKVGLRIAVHIEPYDGRNVGSLTSDFAYLRQFGITDFYIYQADYVINGMGALNNAYSDDRVFAETANEGIAKDGSLMSRLRDNNFQGVYTYDVMGGYSGGDIGKLCADAHANRLLCMPSVGPGFDGSKATPIKKILGRDDGATYDSQWQTALDAAADVVTITSFNEWHEGTQIEPAVAHCMPNTSNCSKTYDGAWGLSGGEASSAYLVRTLHWSVVAKGRPPSVPASLLVLSSALDRNDTTAFQHLKLLAPKQ